MDAPDARVEVLVDLADREPPEQEADHNRERGGKQVVGGAPEQVMDEARRRTVELQWADQALGERIVVAVRAV